MITFSVVTITYNAAQVLQPTLDSVFMQDYPHVEHLIIDGASTDNTVAIAEAYRKQSGEAENGHTVRIQSEPDNGLYDAMNKGLQLATGDYVVFLNAGDRFPAADTLDRVVLAAVVGDGEERPAVLFGDTDIIDGKGNFLCHRRLTPPARLTWRSFRYGMLVCHQAFYARTDIARSLPYDTAYRYSADVDWCIRVMNEGRRAEGTPAAQYPCRRGGLRAGRTDDPPSQRVAPGAFRRDAPALRTPPDRAAARMVCRAEPCQIGRNGAVVAGMFWNGEPAWQRQT